MILCFIGIGDVVLFIRNLREFNFDFPFRFINDRYTFRYVPMAVDVFQTTLVPGAYPYFLYCPPGGLSEGFP